MFVLAGAAIVGPAFAAVPQDITGVWLTNDNEGAIEIRPCGDQRLGPGRAETAAQVAAGQSHRYCHGGKPGGARRAGPGPTRRQGP